MKAVLISIQPKWCELIASGKKTVEVRKNKPKLETPFKCYIYCTKGDWLTSVNGKVQKPNNMVLDLALDNKIEELNGKVIGEFVCDKITPLFNVATTSWNLLAGNVHEYAKALVRMARLTEEEMHTYAKGKNGYAWHISDLVIYDKPKELSEFYQIGKNTAHSYYDYCAGCVHHETPVGEYPCNECDGNRNYLYRPPQSWCYVEELKGE